MPQGVAHLAFQEVLLMALLNPKQAQFVRKVRGTSLTSASLAYYKSRKGGYTLQRKRGATSVKDPVARRLNLYHGANPGNGRYITHIYSQRSRVLKGTPNMLAVKLNTGEKGWITSDGRFYNADRVRLDLRSLDYTTVGWGSDVSLEQVYDEANSIQKAEIAEIMSDVDWDEFWKEYYPKDDGNPDFDRQWEMYNEIVEKIRQVF